jgi:hypothetical protein
MTDAPDLDGLAAALVHGRPVDQEELRHAARWALKELARREPGRSVEVRVPGVAAVQCVSGPRHTRGTPPNVVETDAATWVLLATGRRSWAETLAAGAVHASGLRADLSGHLPLSPQQGSPGGQDHA